MAPRLVLMCLRKRGHCVDGFLCGGFYSLRWVLNLDLLVSGSGLTVQESIWISLGSRLCKIGPQREGSGFSSPHSLGVSAEPPGYQ